MMKVKLSWIILLTVFAFICPFGCRAGLPTLTVLHTFSPGGSGEITPLHDINLDGSDPEAPLIQGNDGVLYGTASRGGANGTGVIFKLNADGTGFAVLHSFGPLASLFGNETSADGGWPAGALVCGKDALLYGVTEQGGPGGSGTVFKLNTDGSGFTVLHSFAPKEEMYHNSGGASPLGLTMGPDQTLFGVAELGGTGRGLIFTLTQDGKKFRVIHSFDDPTQEDNINDGGAIPSAAVIFGQDGALYGTANIGGKQGCGTVYKVDSDGKHFTVLHNFRRKDGDYKNNGVFPNGSLILGQDGFIYGCTRQGGENDGGVVFKMSADGRAFNVLHTFSKPNSDNADGSLPAGPLVFGNAGRLYGLTGVGGNDGAGVLFGISPDSARFSALHDFSTTEGRGASTGLTLGHDGNLYGVAEGGANGNGTIFRITFPGSN